MFNTLDHQTPEYQKGFFKPFRTDCGLRNVETKLALPNSRADF